MRIGTSHLARFFQTAIMNTNERTEKLIDYLHKRSDLINQAEKGSIEINFSGDNIVPSIKIFDSIN